MELEEMKTLWSNLSKEVDQQKILTDSLIVEMTKERFKSKLNKIAIPEVIGTIICFAMALFIIINLNKMDTWYLKASGLFTISYLIVLPILSLQTVYKMKHINVGQQNYKETLLNYTKYKKRYILIQKSSIFFSILLVITSLPVSGKILSGKDIFLQNNVWYWYVPLMLIFLYFFYSWALNCLASITNSAEDLLKDIENTSK